LAKFHENLLVLRSLLIRLKQGKPQENISRVLSKLIVPYKVVVNSVVPTTNERQAWKCQGGPNENNPLKFAGKD